MTVKVILKHLVNTDIHLVESTSKKSHDHLTLTNRKLKDSFIIYNYPDEAEKIRLSNLLS